MSNGPLILPVRTDPYGIFCDTSIIPEPEYQAASWIAPEEIKRRIEMVLTETREKIKRVTNHVEKQVLTQKMMELRKLKERLGGDTRRHVLNAYKKFDYDHYWFQEGFGTRDQMVIGKELNEVARQFSITPGQCHLLDVGTGNGRILKMMMRHLRQVDPDHAEEFRRNLVGFDIVGSVVKRTRERLNTSPEFANIRVEEANFLALPEDLVKEQFHLVTAMMHTAWHCITEHDWTTFLGNMEQTLRPGGRLIVDTVNIINPHSIQNREVTFDDLKNFYTLLWRKTCDKYQPAVDSFVSPLMPPMAKAPALRKLPRHWVEDSTAGVQGLSYIREVPTQEFLEKIIKNSNLRLKFLSNEGLRNTLADRSTEAGLKDLGENWLKTNDLNKWLRHKIKQRMLRRGVGVAQREEVDEVVQEVTLGLVQGYMNVYLCFEKTT